MYLSLSVHDGFLDLPGYVSVCGCGCDCVGLGLYVPTGNHVFDSLPYVPGRGTCVYVHVYVYMKRVEIGDK